MFIKSHLTFLLIQFNSQQHLMECPTSHQHLDNKTLTTFNTHILITNLSWILCYSAIQPKPFDKVYSECTFFERTWQQSHVRSFLYWVFSIICHYYWKYVSCVRFHIEEIKPSVSSKYMLTTTTLDTESMMITFIDWAQIVTILSRSQV